MARRSPWLDSLFLVAQTASLLGVLLFPRAAAADEAQVRKVEHELRKRKLYFGNIDGEKNPEVTEALRRFQARKGFEPTGEINDETLRALGLLAPATLHGPGSTRLQQCRDFIEAYLRACEKGGGAAAKFYAETIDYFEDGALTRQAVLAREQEKARHWPERKFKVEHLVCSAHGSDPAAMIATFRYRYEVRNAGRVMSGIEDDTCVIRSAGPELKIVAIKSARAR